MSSFASSFTYIVTNPWIFLIASRPLFAYGAGFTSPNSPQRYAVFAVLCLYVWLTLASFTAYIQSTSFLANLIAGAIFNMPLTYFDRLILRKWSFENRHTIFATTPSESVQDDKQNSKEATVTANGDDTVGARFAFGNEVGGTVRGLGTPWEIKGIPHFSNSDPQWIPSPFLFIIWKMAIMIGCFSLYHYAIDLRTPLDKDFFQPSRVPLIARIGNVTLEEIWARLVVNVTFWFGGYCVLQLLFNIPAVIAVCFNPNSIGEWRPAFGSILAAYTLRKFWG